MTVTDATTDVTTDRVAMLEAKIDVLSDRIALLVDDAEQRARQRRMFEELGHDVSRISGDAFDVATRELDALTTTADLADTVRLLRRFVEVAPTLERMLVVLSQAAQFVDDAAPLGTDAVTMLTERLDAADRKGYFAVARAGARVADRVVTSLDEEDLDQLGENVVTILETVREITQPELLTLLGRMVGAVRAEQAAVDGETGEAPGFWALARQLRDPDVRRGMARALHTLRAVSIDTGPDHHPTADTPRDGDFRQGEHR